MKQKVTYRNVGYGVDIVRESSVYAEIFFSIRRFIELCEDTHLIDIHDGEKLVSSMQEYLENNFEPLLEAFRERAKARLG